MFPSSVYDTQTKWYAKNIDDFGIRLDSRSSDTETHWQLWTAATLTDSVLRTTMITLVKKYASSELNTALFPDRYSSENGEMSSFQGRSVVGGHFALLMVPNVVGTNSTSTNDGGDNTSDAARITSPVPPITLAFLVTFIYPLF